MLRERGDREAAAVGEAPPPDQSDEPSHVEMDSRVRDRRRAGHGGRLRARHLRVSLIFLADIVAAETVEPAAAQKVVARGTFIHANPSDPIHHGQASVAVHEGLAHLESDFEVGPGPKFHVYLVPEKDVTPSTAVAKTMYVDLGRLKAFEGSQNYSAPPGVSLKNYGRRGRRASSSAC